LRVYATFTYTNIVLERVGFTTCGIAAIFSLTAFPVSVTGTSSHYVAITTRN